MKTCMDTMLSHYCAISDQYAMTPYLHHQLTLKINENKSPELKSVKTMFNPKNETPRTIDLIFQSFFKTIFIESRATNH
jgi:hypothetical protein